MASPLARALGLLAVAGVAAAAVALWPDADARGPQVGPATAPSGAPRRPPARAPVRERTLPPKEAFSTLEDAVLLASALDKVDFGIGPPLPPAVGEEAVDWPRVRRALVEVEGVYLRWEDEALRDEVMKTPLQHLLPEHPTGAPPQGLVGWGPLFAEVQRNFMLRVENPVVWIGRRR